jgi:hypothetical protein
MIDVNHQLQPGDIVFLAEVIPFVDDRAVVLGPAPERWSVRLSDGTIRFLERGDIDWITTRSAGDCIDKTIASLRRQNLPLPRIAEEVSIEFPGLTYRDLFAAFERVPPEVIEKDGAA